MGKTIDIIGLYDKFMKLPENKKSDLQNEICKILPAFEENIEKIKAVKKKKETSY